MLSPEAVKLKQHLADVSARFAGTEGHRPTVDEMRTLFGTFTDFTRKPAGVVWTEVDAGGVPGLWADADGGARDRAILYLHGGGYVIGDTHFYKHFTGRVAAVVGCRVLSVDYRLAPEHPHPAALDDSTKAYQWMLDRGRRPDRLAIVGDSAGGGLTLAVLAALRDAGTPLPAASVVLSPWADMEATGESMTTNAAHDVMIQRPILLGMAAMYLNGLNPKSPTVSPIHADFTGLPPIYIQVGGHETLLDDSRRVADAARKAGVDVTLEIFPEMQHGFQVGAGSVPESDDAMTKIGAFLRSRLGLESTPSGTAR